MSTRREAIQARSSLSEAREHPDPTPVELPGDWERPPTMEELIQRYVRTTLSQAAAEDGFESFEEADDFEIDEPEPFSAFELQPMQEEAELLRAEAEQPAQNAPAEPPPEEESNAENPSVSAPPSGQTQ